MSVGKAIFSERASVHADLQGLVKVFSGLVG